MTNLTKIAAIALVALTAATSIASAAGPIIFKVPVLRGPHNGDHTLECRMRGNDFYIINFGNVNLESGRQVAWASPETGDGGVITVPKMVAPGDEVRLADLLSFPVAPGTKCEVGFA